MPDAVPVLICLSRLSLFLRMFKQKKRQKQKLLSLCDPLGARTQDPNIKSVVLYQLS